MPAVNLKIRKFDSTQAGRADKCVYDKQRDMACVWDWQTVGAIGVLLDGDRAVCSVVGPISSPCS